MHPGSESTSSSRGFAVRLGVPGDVVDVARVQVDTWREAYAGIVPADTLRSLDVGLRVRGWIALLDRGVRLLVAEADGEVIGYASSGAGRDDDTTAGVGELYALYVRPAWWGRGAGSALHDAALAGLVEDGSTRATAWVLEQNARGRAFYALRGWQPDGATRQEQVAGGTLDEIRCARDV
jgi:GNAT superfamily N-acetyltransferase